MPRFLQYAFAGIILGLLVGVPLAYYSWSSSHYRNFHVVEDKVLYRSAQLPIPALQRLIHDYGIKTVVTLRYSDDPKKPAPDLEEETYVHAQQLRHFRLPHKAWRANDSEAVPAEENVKKFLEIMADKKNHPVLVHCFAGIHRTGTFCAVYRMEFDHWTPAQAMAEMRSCGYVDYHDDVFGYLKSYQPRGYALGKDLPLPAPPQRTAVTPEKIRPAVFDPNLAN